MAVKHNPKADLLITEAIEKMEPFAQQVCTKIRRILNINFPELVEDWKWGPNYYYEGMVCGFWGFKKHASIVFFNGSTMKDPAGVLHQNPGSKNTRHIQFKDVKDVKDKLIISYVKEAIAINKKGIKRLKTTEEEKVVELHPDFKRALTKTKLLKIYNAMTYYKRKELSQWINEAKRDETREKRIDKSIELIAQGRSVMDKYR